MDKVKIVPEWMPKIEETVARLAEADEETQQVACEMISEQLGAEAAAEAKELFTAASKPKLPPRIVPLANDHSKAATLSDHQKADAKFIERFSEAMFRVEVANTNVDAPVLSKAAPLDSAREFAKRHCIQDGFLATYFWRGTFWQWNGCCYQEAPETRIND
jgi:hypothetical protein